MCTSSYLWAFLIPVCHPVTPGSPYTKKRPENNRINNCCFAGLLSDSIGNDVLPLHVFFLSYVEPIFLKWFYPEMFAICSDDVHCQSGLLQNDHHRSVFVCRGIAPFFSDGWQEKSSANSFFVRPHFLSSLPLRYILTGLNNKKKLIRWNPTAESTGKTNNRLELINIKVATSYLRLDFLSTAKERGDWSVSRGGWAFHDKITS